MHSKVDAHKVEELIRIEMSEYQAWLEALVKPIRDDGIEVDVEVEWQDDWRSAMGPAATRASVDLIIKNSHHRMGGPSTALSSSDWSLFRSAPCPVMVAKSERSSGSGNVLLAVKPTYDPDTYQQLLEGSLESAAPRVASYAGGVLHVISSQADPQEASVVDLAQQTGVDAPNVHMTSGVAGEAIARCAAEIDAELVVIGVAQSPKLSGGTVRHHHRMAAQSSGPGRSNGDTQALTTMPCPLPRAAAWHRRYHDAVACERTGLLSRPFRG